MRDELLDLVQHTYDLGCIDIVKIIGSDEETQIKSMAEDRSIVLDAHFVNPLPELSGTFGMPNLSKLKVLLNLQEYVENAKISIIHQSRNGEDVPVSINFENANSDFKNNYRFMARELVNEKLKTPVFKGTTWNVEFVPELANINRLKMQAQANSEEPIFQISTESDNLVFTFGDASNHSGEFVFHSGISGRLTNTRLYRVKQLISILNLVGDKVIRISDNGVLQITVNSGIAIYNYYMLAYMKK